MADDVAPFNDCFHNPKSNMFFQSLRRGISLLCLAVVVTTTGAFELYFRNQCGEMYVLLHHQYPVSSSLHGWGNRRDG